MKKILGLAMVLGVLGVVIGGCAKAEEPAADAATTTGTTAAAPAGDAAATK